MGELPYNLYNQDQMKTNGQTDETTGYAYNPAPPVYPANPTEPPYAAPVQYELPVYPTYQPPVYAPSEPIVPLYEPVQYQPPAYAPPTYMPAPAYPSQPTAPVQPVVYEPVYPTYAPVMPVMPVYEPPTPVSPVYEAPRPADSQPAPVVEPPKHYDVPAIETYTTVRPSAPAISEPVTYRPYISPNTTPRESVGAAPRPQPAAAPTVPAQPAPQPVVTQPQAAPVVTGQSIPTAPAAPVVVEIGRPEPPKVVEKPAAAVVVELPHTQPARPVQQPAPAAVEAPQPQVQQPAAVVEIANEPVAVAPVPQVEVIQPMPQVEVIQPVAPAVEIMQPVAPSAPVAAPVQAVEPVVEDAAPSAELPVDEDISSLVEEFLALNLKESAPVEPVVAVAPMQQTAPEIAVTPVEPVAETPATGPEDLVKMGIVPALTAPELPVVAAPIQPVVTAPIPVQEIVPVVSEPAEIPPVEKPIPVEKVTVDAYEPIFGLEFDAPLPDDFVVEPVIPAPAPIVPVVEETVRTAPMPRPAPKSDDLSKTHEFETVSFDSLDDATADKDALDAASYFLFDEPTKSDVETITFDGLPAPTLPTKTEDEVPFPDFGEPVAAPLDTPFDNFAVEEAKPEAALPFADFAVEEAGDGLFAPVLTEPDENVPFAFDGFGAATEDETALPFGGFEVEEAKPEAALPFADFAVEEAGDGLPTPVLTEPDENVPFAFDGFGTATEDETALPFGGFAVEEAKPEDAQPFADFAVEEDGDGLPAPVLTEPHEETAFAGFAPIVQPEDSAFADFAPDVQPADDQPFVFTGFGEPAVQEPAFAAPDAVAAEEPISFIDFDAPVAQPEKPAEPVAEVETDDLPFPDFGAVTAAALADDDMFAEFAGQPVADTQIFSGFDDVDAAKPAADAEIAFGVFDQPKSGDTQIFGGFADTEADEQAAFPFVEPDANEPVAGFAFTPDAPAQAEPDDFVDFGFGQEPAFAAEPELVDFGGFGNPDAPSATQPLDAQPELVDFGGFGNPDAPSATQPLDAQPELINFSGFGNPDAPVATQPLDAQPELVDFGGFGNPDAPSAALQAEPVVFGAMDAAEDEIVDFGGLTVVDDAILPVVDVSAPVDGGFTPVAELTEIQPEEEPEFGGFGAFGSFVDDEPEQEADRSLSGNLFDTAFIPPSGGSEQSEIFDIADNLGQAVLAKSYNEAFTDNNLLPAGAQTVLGVSGINSEYYVSDRGSKPYAMFTDASFSLREGEILALVADIPLAAYALARAISESYDAAENGVTLSDGEDGDPREILYVGSDALVPEEMTCIQFLLYSLSGVKGEDPLEREERIRVVLSQVGLAEFEDEQTVDLSRNKRLLLLALSASLNPNIGCVIFNDSNFNIEGVEENIAKRVFAMLAASNKCAILSCSSKYLLSTVANHVVVLKRGAVAFDGTYRRFIDSNCLGIMSFTTPRAKETVAAISKQFPGVSALNKGNLVYLVRSSDKEIDIDGLLKTAMAFDAEYNSVVMDDKSFDIALKEVLNL